MPVEIGQYRSYSVDTTGNHHAVQLSHFVAEITTPIWTNLATGLVAHYSFDGNPSDSSGSGLDGTPYNISYGNGHLGQAAMFDGTDSYIVINDTNSLLNFDVGGDSETDHGI